MSVYRETGDSAEFIVRIPDRGEQAFIPYEGKIIRTITLVQLDFNHNLMDTGTRIGNVVSRVATRLHATTKDWVLFNHLFIKEGTPLNAFEVADNERFLRTLAFIQDARILPAPVGQNGFASDSVDLVVVSKDVFSIGGDILDAQTQRLGVRAYDANFLGMGQRIQGSLLYDLNRSPRAGFEINLSRSSIGGSFINGQVGFSTINTGRSIGYEDETALFLRLDRPLTAPDALVAGGLELSTNQSGNFYQKPDSLFYNYRYNLVDLWGGINFNARQQDNARDPQRRLRTFIGARYLQNTFLQPPAQIGNRFDPVYNSQQAMLLSLTLFKLNYYRTSYIYGFGLTEDLPHGIRFSATAGWSRQNGADRPYIGADLTRYTKSSHEKYFQSFVRIGAYLRDQRPEDAGLLIGSNAFSRLYQIGQNHYRQRFSGSFAILYNRTATDPLRIDNNLGIADFGTDSVVGSMRASLWAESIVFLHRKIYGFKIAPFIFGGFASLAPEVNSFSNLNTFTGIGAGIRARNENLIFGTIEAKVTFFPRVAYNVAPLHFNLASNLRFRFRSDYVRAPQVFQLNDGDL